LKQKNIAELLYNLLIKISSYQISGLLKILIEFLFIQKFPVE